VPGGENLDWKLVAALRAQASDQLTKAMADEVGLDPARQRELGRRIIADLLSAAESDRVHDGFAARTVHEHNQLAQAVFNALFLLGRFQPLIDDDTVENIIVCGADNVFVETTDGTLVRKPPVADSDAELLDFLAFVASRSDSAARSFSPANPTLHMRLDDGSRLAASAWVSPRPSVVIRRHRLVRVTLDDLVARGVLTRVAASFLAAAVKARKSIVVAGPQGAGKTTMVRALCAEIPPWEAIGTFETELELFLHEMPDRHPVVHTWEARPGSGELGANGRQAGEFPLAQALADSFRFNLTRQIVGEVRGREVWSMIKAMESGPGSISTTHSRNAAGAINKLVTCAMEEGVQIGPELATAKLAETLDLVVQVDVATTPLGDGRFHRTRWLSEIVHIAPGESTKGFVTTNVFTPDPAGGPAIPGTLPDELRTLVHHGFDLDGYLAAQHNQELAG
jgi:Flp pilus assembly CpaF family ATPase